jgi:hypothetical protein
VHNADCLVAIAASSVKSKVSLLNADMSRAAVAAFRDASTDRD